MARIATNGATSQQGNTGQTTLTVVSPVAGDMRTFAAAIGDTSAITGVSGGGVAKWSSAGALTANTVRVELWWGQVVNTAAPTTITASYGVDVSGSSIEYVSQMFKTDIPSPRWFLDTANTASASSGGTITWPSLTPAAGVRLYFGHSVLAHTGSAGSTSGFTYLVTSAGGEVMCYNTSLVAAAAPTATQSSGYNNTVGALFGVAQGSTTLTQAVKRAAAY